MAASFLFQCVVPMIDVIFRHPAGNMSMKLCVIRVAADNAEAELIGMGAFRVFDQTAGNFIEY